MSFSPIFPTVISSSSRSRFSDCPMAFFYEVILGLRLKETNFHLDAGKAYAVGLETTRGVYYHPANASIPEKERSERAISAGFVALIKEYGELDPPERMANKSLHRVAGAFVEYFRLYPMATDRMQPMRNVDGTPAVEFSFVFDIPGFKHPTTGDPLLYSGRADMLAEYNNALWVFDDKTTGQMGAQWKTQWNLRSQFTGYIYAAKQHGLNPVGAVVRGMALYKNDYKSEEAIVTRTAPQVNRWIERLRHDTDRMLWHWKHECWPHYGEENHACSDYGGCAFSTLCTAANPETYLDVYYKQYRWDPIEGKEIVDPMSHPAIERYKDATA